MCLGYCRRIFANEILGGIGFESFHQPFIKILAAYNTSKNQTQ